MRLGIIGAGFITRRCHLPAISFLRQQGFRIEVRAICDPAEEALQEARKSCPQAEAFKEVATFLDRADIDAVLIAVWPPLAGDLVEPCMGRGWSVLVEKPVYHDPLALARLAEKVTAGKALVQVAYNRRWQPQAHLLRKSLEGRIPDFLRVTFHRSGRHEPHFFRDTMGHPLDFLRFAIGDLAFETVEWTKARRQEEIPSGAHLLLRGRGNIPVHLDIRPSTGRIIESYTFVFPEETWILSYFTGTKHPGEPAYLDHWREGQQIRHLEIGSLEDPEVHLISQGFVHQLAAFAAAAERSRPDPKAADLTDAQRAMDLCGRAMQEVPQ